MAERDIFSRLQRLFSTNVIVRNVGGRQLKIADTAQVQSIAGKDLVDRFSRLYKSPSGMSCLLYTSPSPRDQRGSRMPSSA